MRVLVFARVEEQRSDRQWIAVQTVGPTKKYLSVCDYLKPGRELALTLYVKRRHLLRTFSRPWSRERRDGTRIELLPGVALRKRAGGGYLAETPYLSVVVRPSPDHVADAFDIGKRFTIVAARSWARGPLVLRVGPLKIRNHQQEIGVDSVSGKQPNRLVRDVGTCVSYTARGRFDRLVGRPTARIGGVMGMGSRFRGHRVARGVTVRWPDGTVAGKVRVPQQIDTKIRPRARGNLRCFHRRWFSHGIERKHTFCFNKRDVKQQL